MILSSAKYVNSRLAGFIPQALLILGSGLGFLADEIEDKICIPYKDIPHFKSSTAPGHKGQYVAGRLNGKNILAMQGRLHVYEGYSPAETAYPVQVANLVGADKLILTCACGGVNNSYKVGDLVVLSDYINFTHTSPLVGFDIKDFDTKFVDVSAAFDRDYRSLAKNIAQKKGINIHEGVYFYMVGPQFETPAEIRAIRTLGGDLVGMSAVHETVMARRLNMRVLGIGLVTNMAAGMLDVALSEEEVLVEGKKAAGVFSGLIYDVLGNMY